MRFGIFMLFSKTKKEAESKDGEYVTTTYRLVYKDDLGNLMTVKGTEDDYVCAEIGEALPWKIVTRQKQLTEP